MAHKKKTENPVSELARIGEQLSHLAPDRLQSLLEFARYLRAHTPDDAQSVMEPLSIPRPQQESVISAIRRLAETYPMLDKKIVFDQTSAAMSAHLLERVDAVASIDRLEQVFAEAYEEYLLEIRGEKDRMS